MAYHPNWLHVGLEAVFAEVIPFPLGGGEKLRAVLRQFVETRLLMDPSLKLKYCAHSKVPSGDSERHYNLEMAQHTLRRFLTLVLFLDKARLANVIPGPCAPCLFIKEANIKSSEDVLKVFSGYLRGEGSFIRHLRKMGFVVAYKQAAVEEYDFGVKNLAVDLRDGICLVHLVEAMTGDHSISKDLRVPAISRLQKIHNVNIALSQLERDGHVTADYYPPILAKHVVDGHQVMTLKLLWIIISAYQLSVVVDVEALEREACEIAAAWTWRQRWEGESLESVADPLSQMSTTTTTMKDEDEKDINLNERDHHQQQQKAMSYLDNVLLRWINSITSGYGVRVLNFTTSFSDWRALCLLVHYYYPDSLPLSKIRRTTAHLPRFDGLMAWDDENDWMRTVDPSKVTESECKYALEGEKSNARLVNACLRDIGGIPATIPETDSTICPEEKTTKMIVSFLASRLLDSSMDIRAAIRVQRALRLYFRRTGREAIVRSNTSQCERKSSSIFLFPKTVMSRRHRSTQQQSPSTQLDCISTSNEAGKENAVEIDDEKRQAVMEAAAAHIQVIYRSRLAKVAIHIEQQQQQHNNDNNNATELGIREKSLSVAVQKLVLWRKERKRARTMREAFLKVRSSTIVIQRTVRKYQAKIRLEVEIRAVIHIQSLFRMQLAKAIVGEKRQQAQQELETEAATCIQGLCRIRLAKALMRAKQYEAQQQREDEAATCIQGLCRIRLAKATVRAKQYEAQQQREDEAATCIQGLCRIRLAKALMRAKQYEARQQREDEAATSIQGLCRIRLAKAIVRAKQYEAQRQRENEAATCIQGLCRIRLAKATVRVKQYEAQRQRENEAATCIQGLCRIRLAKAIVGEKRHQARQRLEAKAACQIQGLYRIRLAKAVTTILRDEMRRNQRLTAISGLLQIRHYGELVDAWQRFIHAQHNKEYQILLRYKAATVIQSYYRMTLAKRTRIKMLTRRYKEQQNRASRTIHAFLKSTIQRRAIVRAIQRLAWERQCRREQAIVTLQTWWRFHNCHSKYTEMRHAVIVLQSVVRMMLQKQKTRNLKAAGVQICRYLVAARDLRRGRCWRKNVMRSIVVVQALVRGFLERARCSESRIQVSYIYYLLFWRW